ncbi:MAG: BREX system P-loop protein BrxC [Candidatus Limnocylindrales bacterium]
MTLVRDVLARDPSSWSIPNLGVAKVGQPHTEEEWAVLRYELEAFVAEGEYATGLERILRSYLTNLDKLSQPAVWVSGFYGSGKSHLIRVLESLWTDREFPDHARARGLVHLPEELRAHFRELETRGQQFGGRFAAAGVLSAGGTSVGLSMLAIVFAAAGLPEDYAQARLVLWLREEGLLDPVRAHLRAAGRQLETELPHLYVSAPLASAILAARPTFATSIAEASKAIRAQFPSLGTIDEPTFLQVLEGVLRATNPGREIPLTLVVLDELQQFIGDDTDRVNEVQQLVEACCSHFRSRILFVGAGQMALGATPTLQKLLDRFRVAVALQDRDLDRVVRSVVLRKRPERAKDVELVLEQVSGEISRELAGSGIAPTGADREFLVADYPLLPARRRLWECFLRAVDTGGRAGQLRTQMRVVLDATGAVADRELGVAVPADRIYDEQESALQQSAALSTVTAQLVADLARDEEHGALASRVTKAVYILGKLPTEGPSATGLRATNDTIADLLIEDLRTDGARIRERVPAITRRLVERGVLLEVDGAYLLQTPAAAEWAADFQAHVQDLRTDARWQAERRAELFREAFWDVVRGLKPRQGKSQVSRKVRVSMSPDEPAGEPGEVPIWVRDGWSVTEREVREDAQRAGTDNPLVLVWIPRDQADELRAAMVEAQAARTTVDLRAVPTTEDGRNARAGLVSRRDTAQERERQLAAQIVAAARVYQAGGNEVAEPPGNATLGPSLARAVDNAVLRLFPEFALADDSRWQAVIKRAKDGAADLLAPLGHRGEVDEHPVPRAILAFLGAAGKRGSDVRRHFEAPPYGWPQDAIDGSLFALIASGKVQARHNGEPTTSAHLTQNVMSTVEYRAESVVPTAVERMRVKGLAVDLDIPTAGATELDLAPRILATLRGLADAAGGEAPLPARPPLEAIRDLEGAAGNALVVQLAAAKDDLEAQAERWRALGRRRAARLEQWALAERLLHHAAGLEVHALAAAALDAVAATRSLLDEPDPVAPVVSTLADALRAALADRLAAFARARDAALAELASSPAWSALSTARQMEILAQVGLADHRDPATGTTDELLVTLDAWPLADWQVRTDAIAAQAAKAHELAARDSAREAVVVRPPHAVIRETPDLDAYLEQLRTEIAGHLDAGDTVVI